MAITYNISQCRNGYGLYVRAISGKALSQLAYKMPELKNMFIYVNKIPLNWGVLKTLEVWPAIAVKSDRITRKPNERAIKRVLSKIKALPESRQIEIVSKIFLQPTDKNFIMAKLQYFKFSRKFMGKDVSPFTTQDKIRAENLAVDYASDGTPAKLTRTIGRNKKLTAKQYSKAVENGELKPEIAKGLQGMQKPLKEQGGEMLRRITQKRKKTSSVEFYQKYR